MVAITPTGEALLREIIDDAVRSGKVPAASFAVSNLEKEIFSTAAGRKIVNDPLSNLVDDEAVFWVCSMTKLVTSLALLRLVEEGKVSLDTPVAHLVPYLKDPIVLDQSPSLDSTYKPAEKEMKIIHLLNHSSGIADHTPRDRWASLPAVLTTPFEKDDPWGQYYRMLQGPYPSMPLKFEPGTNYEYGLGSDTVGFIIEQISGQKLGDYCRENIFDPLGLTCSFYLTADLRQRLVALAHRNKRGRLELHVDQIPIIEQNPEQLHLHLGGIGLYTSLRDYLTLLRHIMQINTGLDVPTALLNRDTVRGLFLPTLTEAGVQSVEAFSGWPHCQWSTALCLNTADWPGKRRKGSGFWYGWAGTYYFMDPTTGVAAVFGSQVVPTRDPEVLKLWERLETALYNNLQEET